MAWRGRIGTGKRGLLVLCAVLLALVPIFFRLNQAEGNDAPLAFDAMSSVPYVLVVALSLYWPGVIMALAAQALKILVLLDAGTYNIPPPHTGNFLTDIMVAVAEGATAGGRLIAIDLLLALFGIGLLFFAVIERTRAPVGSGQE